MQFRALLAIGLLVALPTPAPAATTALRPFASMDVFALEWASDPQIAPDGLQVAYVRLSFEIKTGQPRHTIWLVSRDGRDHRPLTGGASQESSLCWSPDGTRLAYVSSDSGGALFESARQHKLLREVRESDPPRLSGQ